MKKNKIMFCFFLFLAIIVIIVAIFPQYFAPYDPLEANMINSLQPRSEKYLLGTDVLGRDIFSRIIYGTRYTLFMTLSLVFIVFCLGTVLGVVAGYFGGIVDTVIMRLGDIMISFPGLILAIAVAGILGPSPVNSVIAISLVTWTKYARLARSMVFKIKSENYIKSAKVIGTNNFNILKKYIVPNIVLVIIATAVSDIGSLMLEISALSFLGFGAQPPIPEWGAMLNEGRTYLARAPWLMFYPGISIIIVVVIFNMLGDTFNELIDK